MSAIIMPGSSGRPKAGSPTVSPVKIRNTKPTFAVPQPMFNAIKSSPAGVVPTGIILQNLKKK